MKRKQYFFLALIYWLIIFVFLWVREGFKINGGGKKQKLLGIRENIARIKDNQRPLLRMQVEEFIKLLEYPTDKHLEDYLCEQLEYLFEYDDTSNDVKKTVLEKIDLYIKYSEKTDL
jgi:hypothetical protein